MFFHFPPSFYLVCLPVKVSSTQDRGNKSVSVCVCVCECVGGGANVKNIKGMTMYVLFLSTNCSLNRNPDLLKMC